MMKKIRNYINLNGKVVVINLLYVSSFIIIFLGAFFSFYSIFNDLNFQILNSQVSGVVFGIMVLYLGIRYYIAVMKLKPEIMNSTSQFSWDNFKKNKKAGRMKY